MRGGEYISAMLPWAVISNAEPTFMDNISILSANSSGGQSAGLLRLGAGSIGGWAVLELERFQLVAVLPKVALGIRAHHREALLGRAPARRARP